MMSLTIRAAMALEKQVDAAVHEAVRAGRPFFWIDGPGAANVARMEEGRRIADRVDGFDRDDLGESPDY